MVVSVHCLAVYEYPAGQGMEIINIIITFYNLLKFQDRVRKKFVFMIDKTELPVPFVAGAGKDIDLAVFQILLQKPQRDHSQTAVDLHCIADAVGSGFLKGRPDMEMVTADKDLKKLSGAASGFPHNKILIVQVRGFNGGPSGKGMVCAADQDQHVLDHRDGHQIRAFDLAFHYCHI